MEAKKPESYKARGKYIYPSDNVNPKLKESSEYCIAFCEALMSEYVNNRCQTPFEFGSNYSYETLRRYAQAQEGNDTVKKNFFGEKKKDPKTGKYDTTINTSWDGMDVMPKMFDVMRAINQKMDFRTTTRAIDKNSLESKKADREFLKFLVDKRTKELMDRAGYKPSAPVSLEDIGAETEADIDLYFDSGAFVTQKEIASEAAINKSRMESRHKTIQDLVHDDLITIAIAGVKSYIDKANKVVKYRYLDPAKCIIPYSKFYDFSNITKAAELTEMNIGDLKEQFPNVKPAQWALLARDYQHMNPDYQTYMQESEGGYFGRREATHEQYGIDPVNSCKILVMDCQWLSVDQEYFLTNEKKHSVFKEVEYGFSVSKDRQKRGDKVIQKKVIRKYHAFWVVGTKIMLDCGQATDQIYYGADGNKTPRLDFFFTKTGNKSLVERCIPHIEDVHLAAVKRRNALATLPPAPRMIVQQQLMDNVFLNGIRQEPEDLYQKFIEKGYLVVNNLDAFNKPIFQNSKAIEFVPAGILEDIALFTNEIKEGIERIREVTGLNAVVDASTPNSYVGLGKSQMAASAANNALSPTFHAFESMLKDLNTDIVKKWQIVAKTHKGISVEHSPLGTTTLQTLALSDEFTNADYNVYVDIEFTDDERRGLLQKIIELNATYKNSQGASGISTAELIHLEELIMSGSFKFAKYFIAKVEMKRERMAMKFKRESEMLTFEAQKESANNTHRNKMQEINDAARKDLLIARVTEAEKRKTKLTETMADSQADPATIVNTGLIQGLITAAEAEIQQMLANDLMMDQKAGQPQQQQQQQQVA